MTFRKFRFFVFLSLFFLLIGCPVKKSSSGNTLDFERMSDSENEINLAVESDDKPVKSSDGKKIDLDLSKLNYNLAYAQIFEIMINIDKYLGKTVKIKGNFYSSFDEDLLVRHYSVLIWDATACCQTGLQFILRGEHEYPADYPEEMCEIEITGTLCIKDFNGMDYIYLDVESL